jgi:hypothetical protein
MPAERKEGDRQYMAHTKLQWTGNVRHVVHDP